MYDSRLGRWMKCDPMGGINRSISLYAGMGNNPIFFQDKEGKVLYLGGDREQALRDIISFLPDAYKNAIGVDNCGRVYIEASKISNEASTCDQGIILLEQLIAAPENYLYQVSNYISYYRGSQGACYSEDLNCHSDHGINNWSITKYSPETKKEWEEWKNGEVPTSMSPNERKTYSEEYEGDPFDGIVTIAKDGTHTDDYGNDNRKSTVFHELAENYERTHNRRPYAVTYFDKNGNALDNLNEANFDRSVTNVAHLKAKLRESGLFNRGSQPGHTNFKRPEGYKRFKGDKAERNLSGGRRYQKYFNKQ